MYSFLIAAHTLIVEGNMRKDKNNAKNSKATSKKSSSTTKSCK